MKLVAISNRNVEAARRAYTESGIGEVQLAEDLSELETALDREQYAVTDNPLLLCRARQIDAVIEVTGTVEFAAGLVLEAIHNKKHVF